MHPDEARVIIAQLQAAKPVPVLADSTVAFWANMLATYELEDAQVALAAEMPRGFAGFTRNGWLDIELISETIRVARAARLGERQLALGGVSNGEELSLEEWMAADPEGAARWRALQDKIATPVAPMTRAEIEEEGQLAPKRTPVDISSGLCPGLGKVAVDVDGVLVCPACGSPLDEGCRPSSARGSTAVSA